MAAVPAMERTAPKHMDRLVRHGIHAIGGVAVCGEDVLMYVMHVE